MSMKLNTPCWYNIDQKVKVEAAILSQKSSPSLTHSRHQEMKKAEYTNLTTQFPARLLQNNHEKLNFVHFQPDLVQFFVLNTLKLIF